MRAKQESRPFPKETKTSSKRSESEPQVTNEDSQCWNTNIDFSVSNGMDLDGFGVVG